MTLFHALGPFAAQGGVVAAPGMILMKPTSITHSGTSATLGANGQVTFTAVNSVSLNGCFTADFDNYVISLRATSNTDGYLNHRYRASGSDDTGSNYTYQELVAAGSGDSGARATAAETYNTRISTSNMSAFAVNIYGPALAQPTASRSVSVGGLNGAELWDFASTHSLSTSYDGITFFFLAGARNMTGKLAVYGIRS